MNARFVKITPAVKARGTGVQRGVVIVPSAFSQKTQRVQAQFSTRDQATCAPQGPSLLRGSPTNPPTASVPNTDSQHKNAQRFFSKTRRALTLNALSDSMDSRSPSTGIKSRLYCSRWMKDPSTPCSFSHCSQSRLRRGTKRMWKSLWGERPLSSLEESQAGAQQTVTQLRG